MRSRSVRLSVAGALAITALASGLVAPAAADESDDRRARAESEQGAVASSMEELNELLEDTDAELVAVYADLQTLTAQLPGAQAELSAAEAVLDGLEREAAMIGERLTVTRAEDATITAAILVDTQRAEQSRSAIGQLARDAYKGSLGASAMSAVLDAQNATDFIQRSAISSSVLQAQTQALRDLEQINGLNGNRRARLTAVQAEITELKDEADAKVVEADAARITAQRRRDEVATLVARQQANADVIEARRADQLERKVAYEAQQAALASELAAIVRAQEEERARQVAAAAQAAVAAGEPAPPPPPSAQQPGRGVLAYPSPMNPPVITSPYGYRVHPIYGYRKLHAGTDFRAYCGTPIIASAAGTVQWAKSVGGFGNQVMLNHGLQNGSSLLTSYNHLSSFAVTTGQTVTQGQVVGYSGTTGTSTACHLHFEVYVNGATVDPETLL